MPRDTLRKMIPPKVKSRLHLENRKAMITELKWKCAERLAKLTEADLFQIAKPINTISAIKDTIEILAMKDKLNGCEEQLKNEFKEIFEPIPHVSMLPRTTEARIQLKDAYKKIAK